MPSATEAVVLVNTAVIAAPPWPCGREAAVIELDQLGAVDQLLGRLPPTRCAIDVMPVWDLKTDFVCAISGLILPASLINPGLVVAA